MQQKLRDWYGVTLVMLAGYWALLFTLTHIPGPYVPETVELNDHVAHVLGFAGLSLLWGVMLVARRHFGWRTALAAAVLIAGYAALDEWTQQFIPGRFSDIRDWWADLIGITLGLALVTIAGLLRPRAGGRLEGDKGN